MVGELGRPARVAADQGHPGRRLAEVAVGRGGDQEQLGGGVRVHAGAVGALEDGDRPLGPFEGPFDVGQHRVQVTPARDALGRGQLGPGRPVVLHPVQGDPEGLADAGRPRRRPLGRPGRPHRRLRVPVLRQRHHRVGQRPGGIGERMGPRRLPQLVQRLGRQHLPRLRLVDVPPGTFGRRRPPTRPGSCGPGPFGGARPTTRPGSGGPAAAGPCATRPAALAAAWPPGDGPPVAPAVLAGTAVARPALAVAAARAAGTGARRGAAGPGTLGGGLVGVHGPHLAGTGANTHAGRRGTAKGPPGTAAPRAPRAPAHSGPGRAGPRKRRSAARWRRFV